MLCYYNIIAKENAYSHITNMYSTSMLRIIYF